MMINDNEDLLSYLVSGLIHQHLVKLAPIFVLAYLQPIMMTMMMLVGMMGSRDDDDDNDD